MSSMRWTVLSLILAVSMLATSLVRADSGLGRHKKLYAGPAPGKVTIDGKLDDWDLSAQIHMYVVSETADMQGALFALMYDNEALNLSGVVRDGSGGRFLINQTVEESTNNPITLILNWKP